MLFDYESRMLKIIKDPLVSFIPQIPHITEAWVTTPFLLYGDEIILPTLQSPKAQLHIWASPKLAQIMQRQMTIYLLIKNNKVFPASFTHTTSNNYQHMHFARITNFQYLT